jgi:asparagine synthase (glutamine-hydrolysing)
MCGLTGFLRSSADVGDELGLGWLRRMANAIVHRGPDSDGYWMDASVGVGLAHRRLAIVDLTAAGHQPMASHTGRFMLVFNGEIYNHLRLRESLIGQAGDAPRWRGSSDTETLLAGFESWGIAETLKRSVGMFALAVWDRSTHELTLARDRIGEKPLYYAWQGQGLSATFLFGSELSALRRHPAFDAAVDRDSLAQYMRHNCIGGGKSIYAGVHKLLPGQMLTVSGASQRTVIAQWWSAALMAVRGVEAGFHGTPLDAVDALDFLLRDAIGQQMVADVPLGAFLSGGIDSSTVVALMQAQSVRPVRTFSIGFAEKGYNEAEHAKAVARHLGTDHTELYVSSDEARDVIPLLPSVYSEPFADSSQIPTFLVSRLARERVTVALSGDAGDELFCGYNRYKLAAGIWDKISRIPTPLRRLSAGALLSVRPEHLDALGRLFSVERLGDRLHKGAELLDKRSVASLYRAMVSHWADPPSVVVGAEETASIWSDYESHLTRLSDIERMMALDLLTYLPDDILVKVDRAAMAVSLETRVPFLDHRLVEFAWSLPLEYKLRGGVTKWVLRQVLYRYVPREMIERPKMGFGVPLDSWLRGPLRDWAESLLSEGRLRDEGFFHPGPIRRKWEEHLSGRRNWHYHLWDVLMFQSWLERSR